ncbi:hypothetical protein DINM_020227 [Dirofilaria immitis]|nr:hypothetical protein [Dirofilaria immitis]
MFLSLTSSLGAIARKTKLCGDESCSEKLFEGRFHRSSLATHESFLSPNENDIVSVYAIKFSDRTDLMEGALVREPARKGNFSRCILISMITWNFSKMRLNPIKQCIKAALPELIKDYEVNAQRLSVERQLPIEKSITLHWATFLIPKNILSVSRLSRIGHGHSHNYGQRHSHDHGLAHDHEHYHDRSMHVNSQEQIRTVQHTLPPVILSSETTALPAVNVPTNKPQQMRSGTITSTQHQDVPSLDSEFNVVSEIPVQQNIMPEPVSLMSLPDSGSTANITPDVSETVLPRIPSVMDETSTTLEKFACINYVGKFAFNLSLPNPSPSYADTPRTSGSMTSDGTPPVEINTAPSDSLSISSASSSLETKHHITESEIPSPGDIAAVRTDEDVLRVSVHPHVEPTMAATSLAAQFDPVTASSEFDSTEKMKMEVESEEKGIETTTINLLLESPPVSIASILPLDSTRSHIINPSETENTLPSEQKIQGDPTTKIDKERKIAGEPIQTEDEVKTDIMEEDGLGYCVRGKCDKVYDSPVIDEKIETGYLFVIGRWLSKLIGIARYMLPLPLNNIDDAGISIGFLLRAEMEKEKNAWNSEMNEKFENLQSEMDELKAKYHMLEEENDNLKAETDETSQMMERERRKCRDLAEQNKNLGEKNELLTKQSSEIHTAVEVLHKENERLINETSLSENKILNKRVEELQNETVQLSEIINEIHGSSNVIVHERSSVDKTGDVEKDVNGKNGWSDFDEDDMDNSATEISEKPKKIDFRPLKLWKSRNSELTLQKHLNERDHLMRKVEFAEADSAKRLKEEAKLRNTEELTEKLRGEVMKWQEEEADQELKRLKAEYTKLETRNFHEMRQCKQTLAALQQQSLEQAHLSNPSSNILDNANVLNISPSSSDRDYGIPRCSGLVTQPLLSHVRPLWDDEPPEIFSSRAETSQMTKIDPMLNDVKPENGNINYNRGSKQRRSIREREHNVGVSMAAMQSHNKKEGRRMRSRSHGRHPFRTDYFPVLGMPGYREFSADHSAGIISKQNSKSGTLYYSSGGSNDGRSPPPEMALLSGVPPPGPMIKNQCHDQKVAQNHWKGVKLILFVCNVSSLMAFC